jgi:hypothetical protein
MAMCPGDTTEWDDIHRKLGNFAPKPKAKPQWKEDRALQRAAEKIDPLKHCSLGELNQLEDEVEEDTLEKYRKKRLAELKAKQEAAKFGEVLQVTRTNFVAEVTEGSRRNQWVLVLLYVDAMSACHVIKTPWEEVARRFPNVKFMRGVASEVVPDFPDDSTPAVLIYKNEECEHQLVGLDEWGGSRCSVDCIEWSLAQKGVVETELEGDPRYQRGEGGSSLAWRREHRRQKTDDSDEGTDDESNDRCYTSNRLFKGLMRSS